MGRPNLSIKLFETVTAVKGINALTAMIDLAHQGMTEVWEENKAKARVGKNSPEQRAATQARLERTKEKRKQDSAARYQRYKEDPQIYKQRLARSRELRKVESYHRQRRTYLEHPDVRERNRERERARRNRPQVRIAECLRTRIRDVLKHTVKSAKTMELIGCTHEQLLGHLERQFQPDMTWGNRGVWRRDGERKWHVDHVIPCGAYDLTDPQEQRKCFNWRNLRPVWGDENIAKSDTVSPELIGRLWLADLVPKGHPFSYAVG